MGEAEVKEFHDLVKDAEGLCHVEFIVSPESGGWVEIKFLEGPLKGKTIEFNEVRLY